MGLGLKVKELADFHNPAALGRRVRRFGRAIANDLGLAAFDLFEVNSGDVLVTSLYGVVTTAITGAALPRIQFTPDDGAITPMCTAALSITGDAIDTVYGWDGTLAGVLAPATGVGIGIVSFATNFQILVPGVISLTNGGAVCTVGVIDWVIHYVPLDTDSVVIPVYG